MKKVGSGTTDWSEQTEVIGWYDYWTGKTDGASNRQSTTLAMDAGEC